MKRVISLISFLGFYLVEVLLANVRIAFDILTPTDRTSPRFVTVPLGDLTRRQVLVLTNLITMTPGTLCIDVSMDGRELLIHSLYAGSDEEIVQSVHDYERRVRHAF